MIYIDLDFETRSLADLKEVGAWRYAEDVSTEVICLCFVVDNKTSGAWVPGDDNSYLYALANNPEIYFTAHNAQFEQAIWQHQMVAIHGFPPIPIHRWDCTLAACAWKGYPLALGRAAKAARLNIDKDMEGNRLTLGLSKLNKKTGMLPEVTPQIRQRVIQYCQKDVEVEGRLEKHIGLISRESKHERRVWELDQAINRRGVRLDMAFVEAAQSVVDRASAPLRQEFTELTGLSKIGSPRLKDWCAENGAEIENLQKGYLSKLLATEDEDDGYLSLSDGEGLDSGGGAFYVPDNVRRVLQIRQMLGSASIKKLKRMQACVGYDGRARGLLQYHAAHSGRWGGRLLQPQNFPRESAGHDPEAVVQAILSGDPSVVERELQLPALEAVSRSLRHALIPDDGKVFQVGDYKSIEAVIVLALAGHYDLANAISGGMPIYMETAEQIYNKPRGTWAVADPELYRRYKEKDFVEEYTKGKATILATGFGMGPAKFHERYCPDQPFEFAENAINYYRKQLAPKVPPLWYALHEASLEAVKEAKRTESYGIIFEPCGDWLRVTLPSQWQKLWYPYPRMGVDRFGGECWQYLKPKGIQMVPVDMYGGIETENVVQALGRGLLCAALDRLDRARLPVVLTTHDECVIEVDEDKADMVQFNRIMAQPTAWSEDLGIPIAVESWSGKRYKK